jgi:outer membrane protein assembly factor BamB
MKPQRWLLGGIYLVLCAGALPAADWPQWRGPHRDGVSAESGLLKEWPAGGPKLLWKAVGLGGGYSAPSVAAGRVYLIGARGQEEHVIALNETDGKQLWSRAIGRVGPNKSQQWPGPRSTPTVDGNCLYALGSDGDLACLEVDGGKIIWRKSYRKDLGGIPGNWAYAESPLVDGDVVVCTPGGSTATLAALKKADGSVLWRSPLGDRAAYSSAVVGETGSVRQYIQMLAGGLVSVDAKTGKLLWRYTKSVNKTANIPSPLFHDGYVFSANGYGAGGGLIKLVPQGDKVTANQVWFMKSFANQIGGVVLVGDSLYGSGARSLLCVDFLTGKEKWESTAVGKASICYADGRLYVRQERGSMLLLEATPAGPREKGRFKEVDSSGTQRWPYPVVANGRLYLRDQGVLQCYDVKAPSANGK